MVNKRNMLYLKLCLGLVMMRQVGTDYTEFIFITLHWQWNHSALLESHFHLSASLMFLVVSPVVPVLLNFEDKNLVKSKTSDSFGNQSPKIPFSSLKEPVWGKWAINSWCKPEKSLFCQLKWDKQNPRKSSSSTAYSGEGNGNPLQDPCLENPMDTGAW